MSKKELFNFFYAMKFQKLLFFFILFPIQIQALSFDKGKELFFQNCDACHRNGINLIIPEKNFKKETLEANGMNTIEAITYQILNGKNGMPAFGGRLLETEIEDVAFYVLQQSEQNNF